MLTYAFFITKGGKLAVRLRNNRRKAEYNFQDEMTEEELHLILNEPKVKKGVSLANRTRVNGYKIHLDRLRLQLRDSGKDDMDVFMIRDMFIDSIGRGGRGTRGEFEFWFEKFIGTKEKEKTKDVYRYTLDLIRKKYPFMQELRFSDINAGWLEDFERDCRKTLSVNAVSIHLRNIRAVFNYALMHDLDIPYPFRRFKIKSEKTRKRSLSVEDLRELFQFPVDEYAIIYRDMFKLIFMLCGINTIDLYNLEDITSDDRVEYRREKTGELYSIKVEPEIRELMEKYKGEKKLLCLADRWQHYDNFRRQCNKALRLIGCEKRKHGKKTIGNGRWPDLTTYWARHTWATIARRIGVSVDDIALALGHSSGHRTTDIYIDEDMERIDRANRRVLDWVLYEKRE